MELLNKTLVEDIQTEVDGYRQDQFLPLRLEYLGNHALNPLVDKCTSSRNQMTGSYIPTAVAIHGQTRRSIQTGMDRQFAKGCMGIRSPKHSDIHVLKRFRRIPGEYNPEETVIYRELATGRIGMMSLPKFQLADEPFGFRYCDPLVSVSEGSTIPSDKDIIRDSSVTDDGDLRYGAELPTAMMDVPAVGEDGFVLSDDPAVMDALTFTAYEKSTIMIDSNDEFLIPIHEGDKGWKIIPDIGDLIRDDGMVAAKRKRDVLMAPIQLAAIDTPGAPARTPNTFSDKPIYGRGGARVVDIKITRGHTGNGLLVNRQLDRYISIQAKYIYSILDVVYGIMRKDRKTSLTPQLQRFMTNGIAYLHNADNEAMKRLNSKYRLGLKESKLKQGLNYSIRESVLSGYQIEIVTAYDYRPTLGIKMSAMHGDKGVVCDFWPAKNMPVDQWGRKAAVIVPSISTIGRSNVSRLFEHYLNAIKQDFIDDLRESLGTEDFYGLVRKLNDGKVLDETMKEMVEFMRMINPEWALAMIKMFESEEATKEEIIEWVAGVISDPLEHYPMYVRPDQAKPLSESVVEFEEKRGVRIGPLTYTDKAGRKWTTKSKALVASMYYMLLNKLPDTSHAVSSTKRQPNGITSRLSPSDRHAFPGTLQATRIFDETTSRIGCTSMPYGAMAELSDRANNPIAASAITDNMYASENPLNEPNLVKRSDSDIGRGPTVPLGSSRTQQLATHPLSCSGIKLTTKQE